MLCSFCLSPNAHSRCAGCNLSLYCSKDCQKSDWKVGGQGAGHKAWCGVEYGRPNDAWAIQPIEDKGLGLFALRYVPKDARIMVDRMFSQEEFFDPGFRLRSEALNLAGGPSMECKFATNCIGNIDDRGNFGGLCMMLSRANHACDPTAVNYYDPETRCMVLHASRDLMPGEEITISYTEYLDPFTVGPRSVLEAHQRSLRTQYGIVCPPGCACISEAHLLRKRRSDELEKNLIDRAADAFGTPSLAQTVSEASRQWIDYHADFPLRTRYRVRLNTRDVRKQLGLPPVDLGLYELACMLTFPGSKDAQRHR